MMTDPLHYDDPEREGNVDTHTYFAEMQALAAEVGDDGLHTLPEEYLREEQ